MPGRGGVAAGGDRSPRTGPLSVREVEVVQLIAGGATNDQIAARLVISTRTVHSHVQNAMRKTGARNRTDLAVIAVQDGLVPDREADQPAPLGSLSEA